MLTVFLNQPRTAIADVAGQQATGSANYPNGGLNFAGDMDISKDLLATDAAGGIYSAALDPTTGYVLTGSIRATVAGYTDTSNNQSASLLSKMKLYSDGQVPTIVGHTTNYHDNSVVYGSVTGSTSMVIDSGSGLNNLSDHYAYVGTTGGKIMKVQLNPPDAAYPNGDADAAPKVVNVLNPGGQLLAAAIDSTYAYFFPSNTGKITRIKLSDNSTSTITGLPSLAYGRTELINNTLYLQAVGASIVEANLANVNNGVLTSYTSIPTPSALGTFVVDASQPYAYTGFTALSGQTLNPNQSTNTTVSGTFTKSNLNTAQVAGSVPFSLPSIVPAGQNDHTGLSLAEIDPDSHEIIVGTDNNLPGNVAKFSSGGNSNNSPVFAGAIQMPLAANYNPPNNNFPYRVGDINMRASFIDPKSGYVYFGTDTNTPHLLEVQYSQKGSIKGNKVAFPAGAALTSVNFYVNLPAAPTASSSGNIRLAIYSDNGGTPSALLWQSAEIPTQDVPANGGWLSVTDGLPTISKAGDYWLAWQADTTLDLPSYTQGIPGDGFTVPEAYGTFPASIPVAPPPGATASLALTSDLWSMNVAFNTSLPGDFNGDSIVDAADYVVWRKGLGTTYSQSDYGVWRSHFGQTAGSGSGAIANAVVPEPATMVMLITAMLMLCSRRRAIAS